MPTSPKRFGTDRSRLLGRLLTAAGLHNGEQTLTRRRDSSGQAPLSFAQQRMWFLDQLHPGTSFYNIHVALRLEFGVDPVILQRCVNEIGLFAVEGVELVGASVAG